MRIAGIEPIAVVINDNPGSLSFELILLPLIQIIFLKISRSPANAVQMGSYVS